MRRSGESRARAAWRGPFWGLLVLIGLTPIALAGVPLWAKAALAIAVAGLLAWWAIGGLIADRAPRNEIARYALPGLIVAGLIAWILVQTYGLAPAAWQQPSWAMGAAALGATERGALTLDPFEGATGAMLLAAYAGIFWLAAVYGRDRRAARVGLIAVAGIGCALALYGLAVELSGAKTILWYDKWAYRDSLTATFVNRNAFGAYMGMSVVVTLALLLREFTRAAGLGLGSRAGMLEFADRLGPALFVLTAALAIDATALLLSDSRGAMLATALGVVVLIAMLALGRRQRKTTLAAGVVLLALAGVGLLEISGGSISARFPDLAADSQGRRAVYAIAIEATGERPLLGAGAGSFREVFDRGRDRRIPDDSPPYDFAHSSVLETALELGLPAFAAAALLLAGLVGLAVRAVLRRRGGVTAAATGVAASALLIGHSTIDFSLQIPAVAATYALLLGLATAQAWGRR